METQRPVAPLMGNKRTAADNSRWTDYRKKVKAWNRARFPRETLEQRRAREASERVAEFRKALQSLANDYHYANLPREMIDRVIDLVREAAPVSTQAEAWITRASQAPGASVGASAELPPLVVIYTQEHPKNL